MKLNRTAAVVIGAAVLVSGSIGAASADDIAKMITSKDIKDGTIQVKDLTDGAAKRLAGADGKDGAAGADGAKGATGAAGAAGAAGAKGDTGPAGPKGDTGPAGPKGDTGAAGTFAMTSSAISSAVPVATGGPINTNATRLPATKQTLPAGTYMISVDGAFMRPSAATDPAVSVWSQLSLWIDKNQDGEFTWQNGEGDFSPNALVPNLGNRHIQVSGSTVITLTEPTAVALLGFGYASDQASGNGPINLISARLTAVKAN